MTRRQHQSDDGFFTIWVLGLCICMLGIGGVGLDLWRGFSDRRQLAAMTDAAAVAGASQLDISHYKSTGQLQLDATAARRRALDALDGEAARNGVGLTAATAFVAQGAVEVRASTELRFSLLRLLAQQDHITITTTSAATPEAAP